MKVYFSKSLSPSPALCDRINAIAQRTIARDETDSTTFNGRAPIDIDNIAEPTLVTKPYYRGGMLAKFVRMTYFSMSDESTRMVKELRLLDRLAELRLPAPRPIAAIVYRKGPFYRGQLVTEFIENTGTFADSLNADHAQESDWRTVGSMLRRFHDCQVDHTDLNATNILLDKARNCFLLDFDKCSIRAGHQWKVENLLRLRRSVNKIRSLRNAAPIDDKTWRFLLEGYDAGAAKNTA